jgi:hypothetical protein
LPSARPATNTGAWPESRLPSPAAQGGQLPLWAAARASAGDPVCTPARRARPRRGRISSPSLGSKLGFWCLVLLVGLVPGYAAWSLLLMAPATAGSGPQGRDGMRATLHKPPTLEDFWHGQAVWQLDSQDVGLPVGESDTLVGPDGLLWSYLHASFPTAGIRDRWGAPVPFPGCITLWKSADGGRQFKITQPACLIDCLGHPCDSVRDHVDQQQYPRVARDASGRFLMVYEWRGWNFLRTSVDGLHWSAAAHVGSTRQWNRPYAACRAAEAIGPHPFIAAADDYDCSIGGPPGLLVDGETLYVFVGLGKNPGRMGCYEGRAQEGAAGLRRCQTEVLFEGARAYGPREVVGAAANLYFDFRTISSADVVQVGERYYMAYEGVRGPSKATSGDDQFNLGFARSSGSAVDGPWEKYPGNPVLMDVPGNVGVGHADLLVLGGTTYLYTVTSATTRGRYVLAWRE